MPTTNTIRFCTLNPRSLKEREELLAQGCESRDCLGRCSMCFDTRFVVADDTTFVGDDYPSAIARARAHTQARAAAAR